MCGAAPSPSAIHSGAAALASQRRCFMPCRTEMCNSALRPCASVRDRESRRSLNEFDAPLRRGDQLGDCLAVLDNENRPTSGIGKRHLLVVNSQVMIDCRQEVVWADLAVHDLLAALVRGANDSTRGDTTAGPEHRVGVGPVISTGLHSSFGSAG